MLKVIKKVGNARLCDFETVHGTIHTPAFMNVATAGAIKGGLSAAVCKNRTSPPSEFLKTAEVVN